MATKQTIICPECHGHGEVNVADCDEREHFVTCRVCEGAESVSVSVYASQIDETSFRTSFFHGAAEILGARLGDDWASYETADGDVVVERKGGKQSVSDAMAELGFEDLLAPICVSRDRSGTASPFAMRVAS